MSTDFVFLLQAVAWPLVLLLAWFAGERLHEAAGVPRVSSYVAVGLVASLFDLPGLTNAVPGLPFLANVALSLILFELGYRMGGRTPYGLRRLLLDEQGRSKGLLQPGEAKKDSKAVAIRVDAMLPVKQSNLLRLVGHIDIVDFQHY